LRGQLARSAAAFGACVSICSAATCSRIGALITLGKVQGRVVRHFEDGFAVEFTRLQHSDFLEENVSGA
jgi:hypothetical protein